MCTPPTPIPAWSLHPLVRPTLTNIGCTTVTGIAKGHKRPCPLLPVDWSNINFKGGGELGIGICNFTNVITYPLIMAFNVQGSAVFIHEFPKIPQPWDGENTLTRSADSLPRFDPPPPPPPPR